DKSPNEDISPKPTIFLPSVAEKRLHDAGTYLCLLEDFFPDIIKIDWKEKDGKRILTSQQGDTMKTKDTYMKFSWLTVTGASLDKDHKCIVTHKNNKGGVDQEILFPPIKKVNMGISWSALQLQLTNTSAYYTHVLLLVKSLVYSAIMAVCLLRRPALCGSGTSS
uniref:Immunoglobulin C1-set domain-containing protein n=1 Tax=Ursus americanus TaxID=9643 RepID=A0A452Q9F4_URSAM